MMTAPIDSPAAGSSAALDATVPAQSADPSLDATAVDTTTAAPRLPAGDGRSTVKSTVLPKFAGSAIVHHERLRYEVKTILGQGGMGEVTLAEDHDIGRAVALKHLHSDTARNASSLARFVEEIRTVGALEHPNIVPIHDVGVGEDGRYFFVMKHVQGETLERIIERLSAGDPEATRRYTFTARVEIMMGLLRALEYAHAQGIIHRDIKPANVMVGAYGEVVLMDWGVAKPKRAPEQPRANPGDAALPSDDARKRLFTTRHGSLVGTPAYMSPEQARGDNGALDERSDLYSAAVLFHELVSLRHYMSDKTTLEAMLLGVIGEEPHIVGFAFNRHPVQGLPPMELMHICAKGMRKAPDLRFQSAGEFLQRLEDALDGKIMVQCPFTLSKRVTREAGRFLDRAPAVALALFVSLAALVLFSLFVILRALV